MIAIVTDSGVLDAGEAIRKGLSDAGADAALLPLGEGEIKPCRGCGGCETKSFRRCVFRDGADKLLPYIAQSDALVIVTPLTFGGYSYEAKLLVDKLALLGDVHYYVRGKELSKAKASAKDTSSGKFFVVGITEGAGEKEAAAFRFLVRETLWLTGWSGGAILSKPDCDGVSIAKEVLGA